MDRRKFIKITGATIASLITSQVFYGCGKAKSSSIINYPDGVNAFVNGKQIQLKGKNGNSWENSNIAVSLNNSKQLMNVSIEAPGIELESIVMVWNVSATRGKILNDHWERTYGDVSWHQADESEILPWYFLEYDGQLTNGFGVETGAKTFCYWQVKNKQLILTLDTHSGGKGVLLENKKLDAANIIVLKGEENETPFITAQKFMKLMCPKSRLPKQPVYGINDWYYCYGNNSAELILEQVKLMGALCDNSDNKPFSVIDDGWFLGKDLSKVNQKFKDMAKVAGEIKELGMRPGIWTRPLISDDGEFSETLLLKRENSNSVIDPTIPENLETIKNYFRLYREWGYEMVKFDYTSFDLFGYWGQEMTKNKFITTSGWSMNDRSLTNAEIILKMYQAIREASNDIYLIGCNTFSHLSAGLFELNRIGDDTSGKDWERIPRMGVNTLAFRGVQHDVFYAADADCVGLTTDIPWDKNRQWMELLSKSGTPLFISAQPDAIGKEQEKTIRSCFSRASLQQPLGEPLDWLENSHPKEWKFGNETEKFDWE